MYDLPAGTVIRLDNATCVYSGISLSTAMSTKEHVIGRRFVPKGKLAGSWNLIVRACKSCNGKKADLEDDISAISLQPDAYGRYGYDDDEVAEDADRKAQNSVSRYTKKPVSDSEQRSTIEGTLGQAAKFSVDFIAPPQVEKLRLFELARFQLMGFLYWLSFDENKRQGSLPQALSLIIATPRSDWGNPMYLRFMDTVAEWQPRLVACAALGFFRIAIRRRLDVFCWSWALEWNKNYRLVGFFGEEKVTQEMSSAFPEPKAHSVGGISFYRETPLEAAKDSLFQE